MERIVDRIRARPERGGFVTIEVVQEYIDATHMGSDGTEWIPGLKRYQLQGGGVLNKLDDCTYEEPSTGSKFRTR